MTITDNRETFTAYDADKAGLLCVSVLDLASTTWQVGNTTYSSSLPFISFAFRTDDAVVYDNRSIQLDGQVIGRLTGNFNNNIYEVRLFCPVWMRNGAPQYYVTVNLNYTPVAFKFMTDTEVLKTPRSVFRDYNSRDAFFSFFPHVAIEMKEMCYNQDFTKLGHWLDIQSYFGSKDWYNEYYDAYAIFNNGNVPQKIAYFGDTYDPIPKDNLFRIDYFNVEARKTSLRVDFRAYWGGGYLKQNVGVCYSSTNANPEPGAVGCSVFISNDDSEPFNFSWRYSGSKTVPLNTITVSSATTYYVRPYMILENDDVLLGTIKTVTTPSVGIKPVMSPIRMKLTDNTMFYNVQVTDIGDSPIVAHGIRVGTSLNNMVDKVIDDTNWLPLQNYYAFSLFLQGLLPNTRYYFQAYATNADGETKTSDYYEDVITEPGFVTPILNSSGFFTTKSNAVAPEVGLSLAKNVTKDSAFIEGYIWGNGGRVITEWGFVTSKKTDKPRLDNYDIIEQDLNANITASFEMLSYNISGLDSGTDYWVSFYAKNSKGTTYSDSTKFSTPGGIKVSTKILSNITKTSAICGGNVTGESETVTSRGVCWGTLPLPTIENSFKSSGSGIGVFDTALSGLNALTRYFVRAYATTATSTTYGEEKQFTTLLDVQPDVPKVSTLIPQVADTFVIGGVTVLDEGTQGIINKGIAISLIPSPTDLNDVESYKAGNADSPIQIDELEKDTDYYVIAYAENNEGFSFGEPLAIKTIADLAAQPFNVDINLTSSFYAKDSNGKTINKVTATLVCVEPSIKEYGIRWTTDYIRYINPELNWMMASNKSTGKTIDIWDMPAAMPIYYYGYAITNSNVESRSVGKEINLPNNGTVVNPNDPPIVPPIVPTTETFNPPANATIGTSYLFGNKRWIKTSDGWERDYTYALTVNVPEISVTAGGQRSVELAQKVELFDVSDTKKMSAVQIEITPVISETPPFATTGYQIDFYTKELVRFDNDEAIKIVFGSNEITGLTAIVYPGDEYLFRTIVPLANESDINLLDAFVQSSTDPVQIISTNATNVELVTPSSSRKVPMESIYGEENKLNRNWTLIRTEEELNSTIQDGFYGVNLTSGEYTPFGNSEFTLQVTQLLDSDWSSQTAIVYSSGRVRMFYRTLSSGEVGPPPMFGWQEVGDEKVIVYNEITATRNEDDFNSIRELMESIDDASYYNRYIINIPAGRWFECDLYGKKYVELKGSGINDTILYSDGTSTNITPLNYSYGTIYGGVALNTIPTDYKHVIFLTDDLKLSDLTIEGSTGKYSAHIDYTLEEYSFEATNCRFQVLTNSMVIGLGLHDGQNIIFNNCIFKGTALNYTAFYAHNSATTSKSGHLSLVNCHFDIATNFFYEELGSEHADTVSVLNCTANRELKLYVKSLLGYYINPGTGLLETDAKLIPYSTTFNFTGTNVDYVLSQNVSYGDSGEMTRPYIMDYVGSNYGAKTKLAGISKYDLIQSPAVNTTTYSEYDGSKPFAGIAITDSDASDYIYFAKKGDIAKATVSGTINLYVNVNASNLLEFSATKSFDTVGETIKLILGDLYEIRLY